MNTNNRYFADQVLTASPQRLQLMLIEATLRAARRGEELIASGSPVAASAELAQAEAIMSDLIGSLRKELAPELVAQVAVVYGFILKSITETHLTDDLAPLRAAIRVLEIENETWRLVCSRSSTESETPASSNPPAPHSNYSAPAPQAAFDSLASDYSGGFTFEA